MCYNIDGYANDAYYSQDIEYYTPYSLFQYISSNVNVCERWEQRKQHIIFVFVSTICLFIEQMKKSCKQFNVEIIDTNHN